MADNRVPMRTIAIRFPVGAVMRIPIEELGTDVPTKFEAIWQKVLVDRPHLKDERLFAKDAEGKFQPIEDEAGLLAAMETGVNDKGVFRLLVASDPSNLPKRKMVAIRFPRGGVKRVSLEELGRDAPTKLEAISQRVFTMRPHLKDAKLYIQDAEGKFEALEDEARLLAAMETGLNEKGVLRVFVARDPSKLPTGEKRMVAIRFPMGAVVRVPAEELSKEAPTKFEAIWQKVVAKRPHLKDAKLYIKDAEGKFQSVEDEAQLLAAMETDIKDKRVFRVFVARDPSKLPPNPRSQQEKRKRVKLNKEQGDSDVALETENNEASEKPKDRTCSKCPGSLKGAIRYRCTECPRVRLCETCVNNGIHKRHILMRVHPGQMKMIRQRWGPHIPPAFAADKTLGPDEKPKGVVPLQRLIQQLRSGEMDGEAGEQRLNQITRRQRLCREIPQTTRLILRVQNNIQRLQLEKQSTPDVAPPAVEQAVGGEEKSQE